MSLSAVMPPPSPRRNWPILAGTAVASAVVGAAIGVLVTVLALGGASDTTPATVPDPSPGAVAACRSGVEARLKSPASAQYSSLTVTRNANGWIVTGAVDSQNSFGAMLRSTFTCYANPAGGGWTVGKLELD
jgi:hypothetical protein